MKNYHHIPQGTASIGGVDGKSGDRNVNHSFAKNGYGQDQKGGSGDSEEVFDDEEISSSCNSDDSGYSHNEGADIMSQEGSIRADQKINNLGLAESSIKIPDTANQMSGLHD